jgi:hypothetical protein
MSRPGTVRRVRARGLQSPGAERLVAPTGSRLYRGLAIRGPHHAPPINNRRYSRLPIGATRSRPVAMATHPHGLGSSIGWTGLITFFVLPFLLMSTNPLISAIQDPPHEMDSAACFREIARKISAAGDAASGAPELCLERLRQQVLSDRVAFLFNVSVRRDNGRLLLEGEVERPEFQLITRAVFSHLGYPSIVDRIEVVPDPRAEPALFGVAVAPHVLTWSQPELAGIPMDEALLGEPVYLLKELPSAWLLKTFTGYWGYARKDQVRRVGREDFIRLLNQPRAALTQDYQAGEVALPAGCRLAIADWGAGDTCQLVTPAGASVEVPKRLCACHEREQETARVVGQARTFLGAPYQLGGKNRVTGIDCSGLVQLSYRAIGLSLPRDAKQQYLGGHLILPCLKDALLPGDVLFFMGDTGQVDHTGLYLGNGEMIHATEPRVCIQSLSRGATNYLSRFDREFLGAKRFWW